MQKFRSLIINCTTSNTNKSYFHFDLNFSPDLSQPKFVLLEGPSSNVTCFTRLSVLLHCNVREGTKNTLRGGVQNGAAFGHDYVPPIFWVTHLHSPHFFGYPFTLPPFFWLPIYPPPIFLLTHLPSPHFSGQTSTPSPSAKKMFLRIIYIVFWTFGKYKT